MKALCRIRPRRIAISVTAVIVASTGNILALGRLRELPDLGEVDAAFRRTRRRQRNRASRRERAGVVGRPIRNLSRAGSLANVFGGNGVFAIGGARAGAINSGAESCDADGINPCVDVGLLFREHAPALFLIEEDDCAAGKALA